MLTDCGKSYPYTGTLSFYDGTRLKTIDKGCLLYTSFFVQFRYRCRHYLVSKLFCQFLDHQLILG